MPTASMRERGSALMTVLWLVTVAGTVVFATAALVRGQIDQVSRNLDSIRAYYVAAGSVERALLRIHSRGEEMNDGALRLQFPDASAEVAISPENKKANVNTIQPEALFHLLLKLGATSSEARMVAGADQLRPGHAPIENLEELLSFRGITPGLYYGRVANEEGKFVWKSGLRDELTVFTSGDVVTLRATAKFNAATRSVMATIRLSPPGIEPYFHILRWYDDAGAIGAL